MKDPLTTDAAAAVFWATLLIGSACAPASRRPQAVAGGVSGSSVAPVELALMGAAIDSLARDVESAGTLCIQFLGGPDGPTEPPAEFLAALTTARRVVTMPDCPPTYERMIARVDSLGRSLEPRRPPGYVDPVQLSVGRPQFDRPGYAFLYARRIQGTSGQDHLCVVQAYGSRPQAVCRVLSRWVH